MAHVALEKSQRGERTALEKAQRTASGLAHNQRLHEEADQRRRVAQWRKAVQQARLARQRGEHVPPPAPPPGLSNEDKIIHNRFAVAWNDRNPHEHVELLPMDSTAENKFLPAIARTPEGKEATKKVNPEQWRADRLKEGWRYVLCWGRGGLSTMLMAPPVPLAYRDRVTPDLTPAERTMTYDDFMELSFGSRWRDTHK